MKKTAEEINLEKGKLIIITAPSGAGKTTIVRHLLKKYKNIGFSISATTRKIRNGEQDGRDYYFQTPEEFKKNIDQGAFIEWEEVYDNQFYGTLKSEVERIWKLGNHIIFDIEVNGARNIQRAYPNDSLSIFIQPPSEEELINRLRSRKTEDEASLRKRMARAVKELTFANYFDLILVNDVLEVALREAEKIVEAYLNLNNEQMHN